MRPTPTVVAAYLLLALVPLLAANPPGVAVPVAAAHLAVAALLLRHARRADPGRVVLLDWLPVLLVPLFYMELPLLNQWVVDGYLDPVVQRWEVALFGTRPARSWATSWPWLLPSELLHAAYLAFYPLIYLPQLPHHLAGRARAFHATTLGIVLAFIGCYLVFWGFPVQGPRYLGTPEGAVDGPLRSLALEILEGGSSRGTAFPSSHVSVATVQATLAIRFYGARAGWVALLAALLAAGAVYGGFHYAVDVVAGAGVGLAAAWLALRLAPESGQPARVPEGSGSGATSEASTSPG